MPGDSDPLLTPLEAQRRLGRRLKAIRLEAGWKRTTLAERSGVGARSIQRLEDEGDGSLRSLSRVAHALGRLEELTGLFPPPPSGTMAELERRAARPRRKRGRI